MENYDESVVKDVVKMVDEVTMIDLFTSNTIIDGIQYGIYRIPGIVVTGDGTLLAYCEARKTGSDWADINILMVRSTDKGITWSAPVKLVDGVSTENTMNNPVMIAEKNSSTVHFLYCKEYRQAFYRKSTDDGLTWSEPVEITDAFRESSYSWKVIAVGPGHGIQLDNGRLIAAVWMANGEKDTDHSPSGVSTIYSDNSGDTWHLGSVVAENSPQLSSPNESTVVQLGDGRVMINMRNTDAGKRRAVSISPDGISNWSTPVYDNALVDPHCCGSINRYAKAGEGGEKDCILFVNANSETSRENLTLRMSEDGGQTWTYSKVLQPNGAAYSDVNVGNDGIIYVFYEKGRYENLTLARFGVNWLINM
jgi:Neuraminidase (sialidase)